MLARQDATLNLARLLKHDPDAGDVVEEEGLLEPSRELLEHGGLALKGSLSWQLTVSRVAGEDTFLLNGTVAGAALQECRRCLREVATELQAEFLFTLRYRPSGQLRELLVVEEEDSHEDSLVFGHPEVDFAALLTQLFAIELPLTVLCKEDCLGLSVDGINLNEHPEAARHEERIGRPSPFAALRDIEL
jgi:uncharacterized protein